jgi:hypothetical protein
MKQTMETKEIYGKIHNLLFYYPLGSNELHAQLYDKKSEDVIVEVVVKDEKTYEGAVIAFQMLEALTLDDAIKVIETFYQ